MSEIHSIDAEDDQFAYRFDTQLLIEKRDADLDEDEIADYITEHFEGNSLIAAGDEELIKIIGQNKIDVTIGSALDLFGGKLKFEDVLKLTSESI